MCATESCAKPTAVQKNKMKSYYDRRNHAQPLEIKVGDVVLVAKPPTNKLSSSYDSRPYTVVPRKGTLLTASRDNHTITRNVSLFKKLPPTYLQTTNSKLAEEDELDDIDDLPYRPRQVNRGLPTQNAVPPSPRQIRHYPQRQFRHLPARLAHFVLI
jgi:hypothetical protein